MTSIVAGTRNAAKLREIKGVLAPMGVRVAALDYARAPDVEETGLTFRTNARHKALAYARAMGAWAMADDSGLCVDALDGAPGVFSARFAGEGADDERNNAKLVRSLRGVSERERGGKFVCAIALASPEAVLFTVQRSVRGVILPRRRGGNGFGYDPFFFHPPTGKTFAEITQEAKSAVSHRGKALRAFAGRLDDVLKRKKR